MNPYPTLMRWGAALLLLALLAGGLVKCGYDKGAAALDQERRDHAVTKGYYAQILGDLAKKSRVAADNAKAASEQAKVDRAAADARYQEAKSDAKRARADLVAGLRGGAVSLHPWWSCTAPGSADGDAAADPAGQDGYADLRATGAADLVAGADAADAWIQWLQAELISTDNACGVVRGKR
ncbi:hypothetical protein ACHZ97_14370 [Lysobacter soli]|uniref:hypothetical protein n=1 Tax=Lysobacter soli TaxID=453783 RepID=UPI0037CA87FC